MVVFCGRLGTTYSSDVAGSSVLSHTWKSEPSSQHLTWYLTTTPLGDTGASQRNTAMISLRQRIQYYITLVCGVREVELFYENEVGSLFNPLLAHLNGLQTCEWNISSKARKEPVKCKNKQYWSKFVVALEFLLTTLMPLFQDASR